MLALEILRGILALDEETFALELLAVVAKVVLKVRAVFGLPLHHRVSLLHQGRLLGRLLHWADAAFALREASEVVNYFLGFF